MHIGSSRKTAYFHVFGFVLLSFFHKNYVAVYYVFHNSAGVTSSVATTDDVILCDA
jgi:hypothetical protein